MASSISILTTITKEARKMISLCHISGRGFIIEKFVVGNGGHDLGDPEQPLSPNDEVEELPNQTFGPKLLLKPNATETGVLVNDFCPRFTGLIDYQEANGQISSAGLIARVISSPIVGDPLLGKEFLYAYGNRPLVVKTDSDQIVLSMSVRT